MDALSSLLCLHQAKISIYKKILNWLFLWISFSSADELSILSHYEPLSSSSWYINFARKISPNPLDRLKLSSFLLLRGWTILIIMTPRPRKLPSMFFILANAFIMWGVMNSAASRGHYWGFRPLVLLSWVTVISYFCESFICDILSQLNICTVLQCPSDFNVL